MDYNPTLYLKIVSKFTQLHKTIYGKINFVYNIKYMSYLDLIIWSQIFLLITLHIQIKTADQFMNYCKAISYTLDHFHQKHNL